MLKSVRLQNFKSFRDVRVNLGPRNFLVGPNMAGKSNLIEVFRFLRRVAFPEPGTWGLANAFTGGFQEYIWKGWNSNLISISLAGEVTGAPTPWTYEIEIVGDARGSIRVQEERLTLSPEGNSHDLIKRDGGTRVASNMDGRQMIGGLDSGRSALEFEIPDWDGSFLREAIGSWYFYQLLPPLMRHANAVGAPRFLQEHGENLSAWLMYLQTRYSDAFATIQAASRDILPGLVGLFSAPSQEGNVSLGSREEHLTRDLSIWEMSDGELAFLALLSLIFRPQAIRASLYCIEELENYLHPRLIETLMELLNQAQDDRGSAASQVIATTHSPHLVDKALLEELIVFERKQGATVVTYPKDKTHLRELLQSEELGLGDLFYSGALQSG